MSFGYQLKTYSAMYNFCHAFWKCYLQFQIQYQKMTVQNKLSIENCSTLNDTKLMEAAIEGSTSSPYRQTKELLLLMLLGNAV